MSGIKGKSGGNRKNSGRPLKYGEPVKKATMEFPESKIAEIKQKVKLILKKYVVKPKTNKK